MTPAERQLLVAIAWHFRDLGGECPVGEALRAIEAEDEARRPTVISYEDWKAGRWPDPGRDGIVRALVQAPTPANPPVDTPQL